jgi:DNA polymerase III epsilon subunit-like protein
MYIVFDTETTGLPISYDAAPSDVDNWPRVVQVAWETFDHRGRKIDRHCHIVRPEGFTILKEAVEIHGISTSIAKRAGVPVAQVLRAFTEALGGASVAVAHNFKFDAGVLGAEYHRLGKRPQFRRKIQVCTMQTATHYCALPGPYGFKWPKLSELYLELFRKRLKDAHDAAADVAACSRCFFELKRLGIVHLPQKAPDAGVGRQKMGRAVRHAP